MSAFGSKRVYTTDSYTTPLMVNSDIYTELDTKATGEGRPWPSLIRQTIAGTIAANRNLGSDLIANLMNGVYAKSKALYAYGKLGENQAITGGFVRGLPTGKMVYTPSGAPSQVQAVIEKEIGNKIFLSSTLIDEEDDGDLWYLVEYYLLNGSGQITGSKFTWRYNTSLGTHPNLDLITNQEDAISPYFPIIPIRENLQQLSVTDPTLYASSRHALRSLGIEADDLDAAVHDVGNTDLGALNHCYVILAVDIATRVPNSNLYLHAYFNKLHAEAHIKQEDFDYWDTHTRTVNAPPADDEDARSYQPPPPPINRIEIKDGGYKMILAFLYINKEIKTGSIGKLNEVVKTYAQGVTITIGEDGELITTYNINRSTLTFQKQVTLTEYEEIVVHGLVHINYITASGKNLRTTLDAAFQADPNEDKNNFIIPLRVDVMRGLGALRTHDLLYDSIRAVFNSHSYQKLKWYQTGLFKLAVVVVAIAIAIVTEGAGTELLSLAMAGIAVEAAVTVLILSFAIEVGIKMVQDIAGPEVALIAAIAYTIYQGDITKLKTQAAVGMQVASGVDRILTNNALADIQKEMEVLGDQLEELEEAEAVRVEDIAWATQVLDDTSYMLTQPNNFLRNIRQEKELEVDLALRTHLFVESMQFTDRPYSHIKLGLKPNKA